MVTSVATTGTIDVNLSNNNDITSYYDAINIDQDGTGAVTVTTDGALESTDYSGIEINQSGNGNVTVTADGTVTGGAHAGIDIVTAAGTTGEVDVTTNAAVSSGAEGIKLDIDGNNAVTIMATGTVTSSASEEAIEIEHSGTGNVDVTTSDTVTATNNDKDAILVNHSGTGNITLTVNANVVGRLSENAINLSAASGNTSIISKTGASFTGGINTSSSGTTTIDLDGTVRTVDNEGINAVRTGGGKITITTSSLIRSERRAAISVNASTGSGAVEITANGDIWALRQGVYIYNYGSGATTVRTYGKIDAGGTAYGSGIDITTFSGQASAITVHASEIDAGIHGIKIGHQGIGAIEVTAGHIEADEGVRHPSQHKLIQGRGNRSHRRE